MAGYFCYIYRSARDVPELRYLDVDQNDLIVALNSILTERNLFARLEIYPEDADLGVGAPGRLGLLRHGAASPNRRPGVMSADDQQRHTG